MRCSAHILNLIVQEGLKVCGDALMKIRESVKYVRGSESRELKFKECIDQIGDVDTLIGLCLDVPTRWNSYLMLQSALGYQQVFASLQLNDKNYKYCPSAEEWKRGEKFCIFLKPFYDITNLISGTSYPTSNLYFEQVWKIQCILIHHLNDDDDVLRTMAKNMLLKFDKYWDEYSMQLAFGFILDPRVKLESLRYCSSTIEASTADQKNDQSDITSQSSSVSKSRDNKGWELPMFNNLKLINHHLANKAGRSHLDIYLKEPALCFEYHENLDVLQWWKENCKRFPDLSLMARDLLSIPITTVAYESAFSIGARVLNKYRSSLLPKCVEALICTRNWLNDFVPNDVDDEDDNASVASNADD
ncbi:zinc finger BED domain-containing protein RICESLEEPER 2-like [Gastrolobium bilobum]|uniref:zinc finger BED domain-containing protein RICESLEEPER 2-like n=1 Tax=Gastrolobium bilobum TaxID=150636 RepID=UPI002AB2568D|nr:zinc finger BED domain-containing protein RICESLEEPER 2-like [Gastrolobium bilobum]